MSVNPIRALLARGSIYTAATTLQLSGALIVLPAITRLLSPEEYGVVALAVVIQQLLAFTAGLGLSSVVTRDYFRPERGPEVARGLVSATVIPAVLVVLVAEATGPEWVKVFAHLDYGTALEIAVFSALPMALVLSCQGLLRAADRAGAYVLLSILCGVGGQAVGLLCVILIDSTPVAFIAGLTSSVAVAAVIGLFLTGAVRFSIPAPAVIRESLRIGAPTVMHNLASYLLAFGNRIVIERVAGVGAVGRFQVAYGVGGAVIYLIQAVNNAWAPLVFGAGEERRWRTLADTTGALSLVTGLTVGGLALAAPLALIVAAPSSYDPNDLAPVSALLALSALPFVAYLAGSHIVFWRGRTAVLAWATPVSAAINLGLVALLIPPIGLEGAGLASIVGYSCLALFVRWRAHGMAEVPWRHDRTLIGALSGSALVAAGVFVPADGVWLAVRVAAAAVVGVYLIRLIRELIAEDQLPTAGDEHHPLTEEELEELDASPGRPVL